MTTNDPIADLLTRIRNAALKKKINVNVPYSRIKHSVVSLLKDEGYIKSFFVDDEPPAQKKINIKLKYQNGQAVIRKIRRISKPGQRIYLNSSSLPRVLNGLGIAIISTSSGVMTAHKAKAKKIGGEVICEVY